MLTFSVTRLVWYFAGFKEPLNNSFLHYFVFIYANLPILSLAFCFVFRAEALAGEIKEFQGQLADYNMVCCCQLLILNALPSVIYFVLHLLYFSIFF